DLRDPRRSYALRRPGPGHRQRVRALLDRAVSATRSRAPDPQRQPGAGAAVQRVRRSRDLEPEEPACHAQGNEPAHGALLPTRGTREEPRATADRRNLPARSYRPYVVDCRRDRIGLLYTLWDCMDLMSS